MCTKQETVPFITTMISVTLINKS